MSGIQRAFSFKRRPAWFAVVLLVAVLPVAKPQNLPPLLMAEDNQRSTPLGITQADIDVRLLGFIAETCMTLTFRNDLPRPLAGDFYFPLPVGATVSGYALDVNGTLVDGVVVEKEKGRQVFEKEARKGVDPGLVEWTRGHHFKTRVFPIPARGTRTVRVRYLSDIVTDASGSRFQLPLNFKEKLAAFHLRLEVVKAQAMPVIHSGAPAGLQFGKWRDSFVAETRRTNASLTGELVVSLPQVEQQRVLVEKASDGLYYFCAGDFPADPRPAPKTARLPALSQVTIFWDASGSRSGADHQRELAWLKSWFAIYSGHALTVNLVPLRHALAPVQRFVITKGDAASLLKAIAEITYDGGTQIGCLTNYPAPAPGGVYFLFTDGLGNFGRPEPPMLDGPLYIFAADLALDSPFLQYLAQRAGGVFFPLRQMTDQQVLTAIAVQPFTFLGTDAASTGVADLYPQVARPLAGRFALVGKLTDAEARLTLHYGAGGKILSRSKLALARADAVEGDLLRRYWAQKKLDDLLVFQKRNEPAITELGKQYGLVTPFTSLMVLETIEQYVEHRIAPPVTLPALRTQYARLVEQRAAKEKQESRQKLDQVVALWQKRVEWWNREFKYRDNFRFKEPEIQDTRRRPQGVTPLPGRAATVPVTPPAPATIAPDLAMFAPAASHHVAFPVGPADSGAAKSSQATAARAAEPGIAIKEWDPKTPYLAALKKAPASSAFTAYLNQRKSYAASPAFYLDCAEFFRRQNQVDLAVQVLSNIAELELENAALLRVLAHRLQQIGQVDLACGLFERILEMRSEEPQSFRDLALALARRGRQHHDRADYVRALTLLARVVNQPWDRFEEIEVIALMELNALWAEFGRRFPGDPATFPADERLRKLLDLDLRIVLTWDADMTDIDLHVTEPSGEQALYSHNLTTIGGLVSRDFTQGYGPEEYGLRKAMHGTYKIEVNYFGSQASQLQGPVTVQAEVIAHFGRPNETRKSLTLRLEEQKETSLVGEVEF